MRRAESPEEIQPLLEFCRRGRLFDVQAWISKGGPVNLPAVMDKKIRIKSPLQIAMDTGFHSLIQVLLEAGALVEDRNFSALLAALSNRRIDLIELMVENGTDISSVRMDYVFDTWQPDIIGYFVEHGADLESQKPLASALIGKIRTALGVYKRYKDQFPFLQGQLNIALRHHCHEGNLKWASLLLWAGADPYERGPYDPSSEPDSDEDMNAVELAASGGHLEILKLKAIKLDPSIPGCERLLTWIGYSATPELVNHCLEKGFSPNDLENGGSSLIHSLVNYMSWPFERKAAWSHSLDSGRSHDRLKILHLLVRRGAKWLPTERYEINSMRRSFLKMPVDYVMEFVWIMSGYRACRKEDLKQLLSTTSMRALIAGNAGRIEDMMAETAYPQKNPI